MWLLKKVASTTQSVASSAASGVASVASGAKNMAVGVAHAAKDVGKNIAATGRMTEYHHAYVKTNIEFNQHHHARSVCAQTDDITRVGFFLMIYYDKWGTFPLKVLNRAYDDAMRMMKEAFDDPSPKNFKKAVKNMNLKGVAAEKAEEGLQMAFAACAKEGGKAAFKKVLKKVIATEVVKASIGGVTREGARRGAIQAVALGAKYFVASAAFQALSNPATGIAQMVGEKVTATVMKMAGIKDRRAIKLASAAGGIVAAATAGALCGSLGGPVGAAGGAAVATAMWGVTETAAGVYRNKRGPNKYFAEIETDELRWNVTFGTYKSDDSLYAKTYENNEVKPHTHTSICAGNREKEDFQVTIWDAPYTGAKVLFAFEKVNYRDIIYVSRIQGKIVAVHCCGEYSKTPGVTVRKVYG